MKKRESFSRWVFLLSYMLLRLLFSLCRSMGKFCQEKSTCSCRCSSQSKFLGFSLLLQRDLVAKSVSVYYRRTMNRQHFWIKHVLLSNQPQEDEATAGEPISQTCMKNGFFFPPQWSQGEISKGSILSDQIIVQWVIWWQRNIKSLNLGHFNTLPDYLTLKLVTTVFNELSQGVGTWWS